MENTVIYESVAKRTGGDVYLGVVGPVRTGKSTFIKRFMETLVLPNIGSDEVRKRALDELPQSGSGKTIMTAEPKFVPEEAVLLSLDDGAQLKVRLVDSVGYMVPGAMGADEDGVERMVRTPWFDEPVTMREAAEKGTRMVITDHSTVGIVVTTDGSVTDLPREAYIEPERRVIRELKELGKPFVVLLNCYDPKSEAARRAAQEIATDNGVSCIAVNCMELSEDDIGAIMSGVLGEFPVSEFFIDLPDWIDAMDYTEELKKSICDSARESFENICLVREVKGAVGRIGGAEGVSASLSSLDMGAGTAYIVVSAPRELFYSAIASESGFDIHSDGDLMRLMSEVGALKREYEKVGAAMKEVRETGYGVVMPDDGDLTLAEPEIVRKGGRYSVKLKAKAPAIHLISTDIETEVSPAVGGEGGSGEVISFLLQEFEGDTSKIWESNIFGKSLHDIAGESVQAKVRSMAPETRAKLRDTIARIINDGAGGLICIIL
ncbi:MAG: stage IV sporulation protein A [Oscillospiraceae bacterium]|nr:stage IV sporulation protein A [Oscillospiraceae bacterium]